MKKILKYLLAAVLCTTYIWGFHSNAAESSDVQIELTGINQVKIYTEDKTKELTVDNNVFLASPGETYSYEYAGSVEDGLNGAGGYFTVTTETTELKLAKVNFKQVALMNYGGEEGNKHWQYYPELGSFKLYDEAKKIEYWHAQNDEYNYLVPQKNGDSYYIYDFTPFDEEYIPIEGHFYVYRNTDFKALNLSDAGKIPYIKKSYITVKAPAGMEVYTTWQLKFYTARNWESYKSYKTEDGYNYYKVPEGFTYMLRQSGKVTWYGKTLRGEWNKEHTEITLSELTDNPTQINREQEKEGIYASMLTNLPENSEIELTEGEYFDLVPLRAWQAVESLTGNLHNDPEWHYKVIGSEQVASVEITKDDVIGQYGRIQAKGEGTVLVAFYYDAVATTGTQSKDYIYSALLPELTGIAVVHVNAEGAEKSKTEITPNIDIGEGGAVYYVKTQKGTDGIRYAMDDHAEYTFTPSAKTGDALEEITSVRVHKPITVENGILSENPNNWLADRSWKQYEANEAPKEATEDEKKYKKSYTIQLTEGRNIVEIKAGDTTTYHVILARGLDISVDNVYYAGKGLQSGDTAKITMDNLLPPMYKMAAIYNPSEIKLTCKTDGVDYTANYGQYMAGTSFNVKILADKTGTYTVSDGALTAKAWGMTNGAHRNLTRNSMNSTWGGGDSPNTDYGKMAVIPNISFEVTANAEIEETERRQAGLLSGLLVGPIKEKQANDGVVLYSRFVTASNIIPQSDNRAIIGMTYFRQNQSIYLGAAMLQNDPDAKLLVRYWFDDSETKTVAEMAYAHRFLDQGTYGTSSDKITGFKLENTNKKIVSSPKGATTDNNALHVETIVIPSDGVPMTYATYLYNNLSKPADAAKISLVPEEIKISPVSENSEWGRWDGVLEADDMVYTDSTGEEVTQDLGYGFIGTETHFTTSVSNATDKIKLSVKNGLVPAINNVYESGLDITVGNKSYKDGDEIELEEGVNTLEVTYHTVRIATHPNTGVKTRFEYSPRTYTIDVTRRSAAKQTTFEVPEGASVLVMQGSKVIKANEDGTYTLENGTYTYYVSKSGYLTSTDSFTVTDEEPNLTIRVESLDQVPEQSGTVSVQLAGQSTVFCPTTTIEIQQEAADLAANRYVQYNHGGYTVLHALLDAAKSSGTSFDCYKGKFALVDDSITENNGKKAAWVCKVNGLVCSDPANVLVENGDKIELFYSSGWNDMLHAHLTPETHEINRGDSMVLTLTGNGVYDSDAGALPVEGAEIYDGNTLLGKTNEAGELEIQSNTLLLGTHRFTAVKKDEDGHNVLTAVMSTVTVKKVDAPSADPNTTTVTFRLIGDTKHGEEGSDTEVGHAYSTWIATGVYSFDSDKVKAGDVVKAALDEAGLTYEGLENNYISMIKAPDVCGGYELREKDNGANSGWMYTVNGVHVDRGMNSWYVSTGDEIILHYIDDYKIEQADMTDGSEGYVPEGNASTWNKWLEAPDETPGAKERAAVVTGKINQIGKTIELTEVCETKIAAAREAYDELNREEKSYVENYPTLKKAEELLADLKKVAADQAAAQPVIELIEQLPENADDLTLEEHQQLVIEARTAYGKLTRDQKKYVPDELKGRLETAEERIAELLEEAAPELLIKEIEALPSKDEVELTDEIKAAIESANAHYDALSPEQKEYLKKNAPDSLAKLDEVNNALNNLIKKAEEEAEANKVAAMLDALPAAEDVMFADKSEIGAARAAYDALEKLQELVDPGLVKKLTDAEGRLEELQAGVDTVAGMVDALPDVDELTIADADQVKEARNAYDALNKDQKRLLTENGVLSDLLVAENQMSWLQKDADAIKKVTDRINSLPAVKDLKLADKSAVQAARNAYENLSKEQKERVSVDTLNALIACEKEIDRLEALAPNPDPTPKPTPTPDPEPSDKTVTLTYQNYPISVTGKLSGYELRLVGLKATDDCVKRMQNKISTREALIRLYDVKLYLNGTEVDWDKEVTINFQVGDKYNGKKLTVLHDVDGSIEKLKGTVSDGILSVTADSLSPFGVVVTASTVTGSGVTNIDSTTTNTTTTVTNGNLSGTTNNTSAEGVTGNVTSAQTGDNTDILLPVAGLITASGVLAGVVLYYKKKRKNTGVQTEEEK